MSSYAHRKEALAKMRASEDESAKKVASDLSREIERIADSLGVERSFSTTTEYILPVETEDSGSDSSRRYLLSSKEFHEAVRQILVEEGILCARAGRVKKYSIDSIAISKSDPLVHESEIGTEIVEVTDTRLDVAKELSD